MFDKNEQVEDLGAGVMCDNCGEFNPGPLPEPIEYYAFDEVYDDMVEVLHTDATPEQALCWIQETATVESRLRLACGCTTEYEDYTEYEHAWLCKGCNDIYETREEAMICCKEYQDEQERELDQARMLLTSRGYQVFGGPTNTTNVA